MMAMVMMTVISRKTTHQNQNKKQANHPVHIINADGNLSPSAFIPFCAWASNMEVFSF